MQKRVVCRVIRMGRLLQQHNFLLAAQKYFDNMPVNRSACMKDGTKPLVADVCYVTTTIGLYKQIAAASKCCMSLKTTTGWQWAGPLGWTIPAALGIDR